MTACTVLGEGGGVLQRQGGGIVVVQGGGIEPWCWQGGAETIMGIQQSTEA